MKSVLIMRSGFIGSFGAVQSAPKKGIKSQIDNVPVTASFDRQAPLLLSFSSYLIFLPWFIFGFKRVSPCL
jgi:hypothetical protein